MRMLLFILLLVSSFTDAQQKELRLYVGTAPGSENWNWSAKQNNKNMMQLMTLYNIVIPTLTIFPPVHAVETGMAVIICPGGGFHFLSIDAEGNDVAKWQAKKGITAFVLKYRVAHIETDDPLGDMMAGLSNPTSKPAWEAESQAAIPFGIADKWLASKHSVEMHLLAKGGQGFGMRVSTSFQTAD